MRAAPGSAWVGALMLGQRPRELDARGDAELREHLAEVVLHGAAADEELRRDVAVGGARDDEPRDLTLLRREGDRRGRGRAARGLAARAQLCGRALDPAGRTERLEARLRGAQLHSRVQPPPRPAQVLAVEQSRPRELEG